MKERGKTWQRTEGISCKKAVKDKKTVGIPYIIEVKYKEKKQAEEQKEFHVK